MGGATLPASSPGWDMPTTKTGSGSQTAPGMKEVARLAALLVATIFPAVASAQVVVTLPARQLARVRVPLGVAVGPRSRELMPTIDRVIRDHYPEARSVILYVKMENGKTAWIPLS